MSGIDQGILSKIQKLLNMTQENGASLQEAETAAAAAQRLMSQHRISMADLGTDNGEEIHNKNFLYAGERVIKWKSWLGKVLCEVNGCKMYIHHLGNGRGAGIQFQVIGRNSDIQIVTYFFNYLCNEIERLCKIEKDRHAGYGKTWTNSFKLGAATSIVNRLKQANKEVRSEVTSTALVKVDMRDAQVEAWAKKLKLRSSSKTVATNFDAEAYGSGVNAGNKIHLNKGMGGKSDPKQLA